MRYHLTPVREVSLKKTKRTGVGEAVEKGEVYGADGGIAIITATVESSVKFPQKLGLS